MLPNQNKNRESQDYLKDTLILNENIDTVPTTIIPTISPVVVVKQPNNVVRYLNTTDVFYTVAANEDFYLTSISITAGISGGDGQCLITFQAEGDRNANTGIGVEVVGTGTLTDLGNNSISQYFGEQGIKIRRGTAINFTMSTTRGSGTIVGYSIRR